MITEQGPNVTDPDARALIAAASAATTATDYLLCAVRDGENPNVEEIATTLADALNCMLDRYPVEDGEGRALHAAARAFLGLDPLPVEDEGLNEDEAVTGAIAAIAAGDES